MVGLIQVLLLAGALKRPIQQFSELQRDAYNLLMMPCGCCDNANIGEPISLMWTSMLPMGIMNHIIPLLPMKGTMGRTKNAFPCRFSHNIPLICAGKTKHAVQQKQPLASAVDHTCMASRSNQCASDKCTEWVQCTRCQGWYHCKCIGLASHHVEGDRYFICCGRDTPDFNPV